MTIQELDNNLHQLSASPSREATVKFSKLLMQFFEVEAEPKEKVIGSYTQTLQKLLVENLRVKNQPLFYQLNNGTQNISCRFAVVKKINKPTLLRLCYQENFSQSWQANIGVAGTDKLPYTIDFLTTEKYNAVTVVLTQGEQIRSVTFKDRLTNLQRNKMLLVWQNVNAKPKAAINSDLWSSLDLKEVNKQFYISIKEKFDSLIAEIKEQYPHSKPNELKMSAIHLIGRYIFCWFLKEKEIIHPDILSSVSLSKYTDRYNKILKRLFFNTLNTYPFPERKYPKDVPEELVKYLSEIPYLNGGLFEPSEEDKNVPTLSIDGWLLSFIRLLEEYNFTVDESSANYEQVAIDPEMLGRILENLLASLNPETEKIANERNALGAFYTPRPIVDYMVTESLKVFFESQLSTESQEVQADDNFFTTDKNKVNLFSDSQPKQMAIDVSKLKEQTESKEKIRAKIDKLFDYSIEQNPFSTAETKKLKQALNDVKIIDPACGSGAFPMGVLHKLEMLHEKFGTDKSPYDLRRTILSQNIYGVDILPMAVEISRLRAWLALVLVSEYKRTDKKHNFNIKALPNLDFKFMCANSLVSVPQDIVTQNQTNQIISLLEPKIELFFSPDGVDKSTLKKQIEQLIESIVKIKQKQIEKNTRDIDHLQKNILKNNSLVLDIEGKETQIQPTSTEKLLKQKKQVKEKYQRLKEQWHSYNNVFNHGSVQFFDTKYFFPSVKNGFDIVIGNPPYLRVQGLRDNDSEFVEYLTKEYKSATGSFDLYVTFLEKGLSLISPFGIVNYIMPVKWTNAAFGSGLRQIVSETKSAYKIISFGAYQVFNASTYTGLQWFKRNSSNLTYFELNKSLVSNDELNSYLRSLIGTNGQEIPNSSLTQNSWVLSVGKTSEILTKLNQHPRRISDIFEKIFQGLATSKDDVYFLYDCIEEGKYIVGFSNQLNTTVKVELDFTKPLLKGEDVHRYEHIKTDRVVIFPYNLNEDDAPLYEEKEIKKKFPLAYSYLKKCEKVLRDREKGRLKNDNFWYRYIYPKNLKLFSNEKLVAPEISQGGNFSYDENGRFYSTTKIYGYIKNESIKEGYKFWLGLLNSKLFWFFIQQTGYVLRGGYFTFKTNYILPFPVPSKIPSKAVLSIENLVTEILHAKRKSSQAITLNQENQIDKIVYDLYGFSEDDIKVINQSVSS